MSKAHILGFPRIGIQREAKKAVEAYWRGESTAEELEAVGSHLREVHWQQQQQAGLDYVTVGDFSWYDHVLDTATLFGIVPERFGHTGDEVALDTYFCMARGQAPNGADAQACEMTKWFDTNYHYIVPEFSLDQEFGISSQRLFADIQQAQNLGYTVKPVILGPLSLLWLGKVKGNEFDKLCLLPKLIQAYAQVYTRFTELGIDWVQVDEPILVLDLPTEWQQAFSIAYQRQYLAGIKCLLTTYFGSIADNLAVLENISIDGLHIDICRGAEQLPEVIKQFSAEKVLSLGVIDGRNIWKADLQRSLAQLQVAQLKFKDNLWVASSCSLLHAPVDLEIEQDLDSDIKSWLAFAVQKLQEVAILTLALTQESHQDKERIQIAFVESQRTAESRQQSKRIHNDAVAQRLTTITEDTAKRQSPYGQRAKVQTHALNLPLFPTTTIGSFPQTQDIRCLRRDFKQGKISLEDYEQQIKQHIQQAITKQEALGLDVLVHGEPERNDMVEFFGEQLDGFVFTQNGWVQSYGSRCVKPPIIYGDVQRTQPLTVAWSQYAQSLTDKPLKGMLTGPVTILAWSFVRDDQPRSQTAAQIAFALRDETKDLERAGIRVIQIDEPAFRETLPLKRYDWQAYLDWASQCFRIASSGVSDKTQIHTHMCYSEFNDIIQAIASLDADVITLESSRSDMELLESFEDFDYPNEIGPGVYDIHSPRVPSQEDIVSLIEKALQYIPVERLWVNPDCGLKTRGWPETEAALTHLVNAAKQLRAKYALDVLVESN